MLIMKRRVFYISLMMTAILGVISFLYDVQIIKFVESLRNDFLDYIFLSVTFASNTFIVFFFLTTLFLWKENKRRWVLPLWLTSFVAVAVSFLLKVGIARPRPFQKELVSVLQIAFHFMRNNFNTWNFSFPSFQAVLVFSALPILSKEFKKFKYIWLIFACLVAFSRVYFGVHYLSDVLAGAVIGYLIGYVMVLAEERYKIGYKIMKGLGLVSVFGLKK